MRVSAAVAAMLLMACSAGTGAGSPDPVGDATDRGAGTEAGHDVAAGDMRETSPQESGSETAGETPEDSHTGEPGEAEGDHAAETGADVPAEPGPEPVPDATGEDAAADAPPEVTGGDCPTGCDPGTECFTGACGDGAGCAYQPVFSAVCFAAPPALAEDFEGAAMPAGWTFTDLVEGRPEGQVVSWALSEGRAHSGKRALHLDVSGDRRVASLAATPPVTPKAGLPVALRLWVWADVEDGDLWDVLTVSVETATGMVPAWTKAYGFPMRQWTPIEVDLSAFAGETFRVVVAFDSIDDSYNDGEGVYLDDVFVLRGAAADSCETASDCDDGIPCTEDTCADGSCAHAVGEACCVADVQCDDSNACTHDLCAAGACDHVPVADPLCCNVVADCDDANECTTDACEDSRCHHAPSGAAGCCTSATDCDDHDACTKDACSDFRCTHLDTCCETAEECDDHDDVCTVDECVDGGCRHVPTGAPGCCTPEVASWRFDGGDAGWTFSPPVGGVGWQVTALPAAETTSPPGALYYGDPSSWDYDNGDVNGGVATSGYFDLPPAAEASLSMQVWMDVEYLSGWDVLSVYIESPGVDDVLVFTRGWGTPLADWFLVEADLSAWAGRSARLRLEFDTVDDSGNDTKGVFVDDVLVRSTCTPRACEDATDCDDGFLETDETCENGHCVYSF